jgi:hypothetical protein
MNTRSSNYTLIFSVFFLFWSVAVAHAEGPVVRSGETIGTESNQVIEGDFYGLGQSVTLSGVANHDVYVLGGTITVNAPVAEDLVIVGGTVQVHGNVGDDVRVIGGEVVIANAVTGDVVVFGGSVHILSTASIGGDLLFLGSDVRIDGPVLGSIYGTGESVRIDGPVGGNVDVRIGSSLTFGDSASVAGSVSYQSVHELVRAQGATIEGEITHHESILTNEPMSIQPIVINLLIMIFSGLTLFFILRSRTERLGLIGLGMLMALPIVAIVLAVSVVGFFVGMTLFFSYLVLCLIAYMALPIVLGALAQRLFRQGTSITIFTVIIGAGIATLLLFIPLVGGFILLLAFLMLTGAICNQFYTFFKDA